MGKTNIATQRMGVSTAPERVSAPRTPQMLDQDIEIGETDLATRPKKIVGLTPTAEAQPLHRANPNSSQRGGACAQSR